MAVLACLTHWYVSLLYVVPVLAVGGWGWWSSKRIAKRRKPGPPASPGRTAASAERHVSV